MKQSLSFTLQELSNILEAKLYGGDPSSKITGLATLEKATAGQLSFLTNPNYRKFLATTQASAVMVSVEDAEAVTAAAMASTTPTTSTASENDSINNLNKKQVALLICKNPRLSLARVAALIQQQFEGKVLPGIHPTAIVGSRCIIPESASIGPYCVLGNDIVLDEGVVIGAGTTLGNCCHIGSNTVLKPRVVLYNDIRIGSNTTIHSGAVIGCDGFGYAHDGSGWIKMPHLAGVTIGDSVEIGANATIDRGFLEDTRIGNGVIIDNLVIISHNVEVGDGSALAGFVGIAGSTSIGKHCMIGGNASIAGHITIGDNVHITATTGINHSISTPGVYSAGLPAKPNAVWRRNAARFQYLDEMAKRLRTLENKVEAVRCKMVEA